MDPQQAAAMGLRLGRALLDGRLYSDNAWTGAQDLVRCLHDVDLQPLRAGESAPAMHLGVVLRAFLHTADDAERLKDIPAVVAELARMLGEMSTHPTFGALCEGLLADRSTESLQAVRASCTKAGTTLWPHPEAATPADRLRDDASPADARASPTAS